MSISIGWDELSRKPSLKEGDLVGCTNCGGEHRVVARAPEVPTLVPLEALVRDGPKSWVDRLARRKAGDDYTRICSECVTRGSVPGDFPYCGPHQWQEQWLRCRKCGESMHPVATFATDAPEGRVHYPHGFSGGRCGPIDEPDPNRPGYFQCSGSSMRRPLVLLSFECNGEWFIAGMNGKALGG